MVKNEPVWIDIDCKGEKTAERYFGRFSVKPYLKHKEKNEVSRLAETYSRGISEDVAQKGLMYILAQLHFHIVDTDAKWWKDSEGGLELLDEEPIIQILIAVQDKQAGNKKEEKKEEPAPAVPA